MRNLNLALVVLLGLTRSVMTVPVENKNEQVATKISNEVENNFDSSNAVSESLENTDNSYNGNIEKVTGLNAARGIKTNSDDGDCDGDDSGDDDDDDDDDDDEDEDNDDEGDCDDGDDGDDDGDDDDDDDDDNDDYFEEQKVSTENAEPQYVDDGEFPTVQSEEMEAAADGVDQGSEDAKRSVENEDPETETGSRQVVDWPDFWCEKECRETYLLYEGCKRQGELIGESCVCSAHFRYKMDKCRADGCGHYYDRSPDWQKLMEKYEEECRDKGDDFVDY